MALFFAVSAGVFPLFVIAVFLQDSWLDDLEKTPTPLRRGAAVYLALLVAGELCSFIELGAQPSGPFHVVLASIVWTAIIASSLVFLRICH